MSANSAAFDHVNGFRWRQGDPSLAESEARLYDLGVLRSVLEESVETAVAVAVRDEDAAARTGPARPWVQQVAILVGKADQPPTSNPIPSADTGESGQENTTGEESEE